LAAIIVVAVIGLIDLRTPIRLWQFSRTDAIALIITFVAVLGLGIETGILVGVVVTVVMMMWKTSRPHVAEVGRIGDSEHFRNVQRHQVHLTEGVLAIRVDESLNFANAPFLESYFLEQISDRPDIQKVLLISSGINEIDATGIEVLETIVRELDTANVEFYLSDVKGPVMDRLKAARFDPKFLENNVFLSAHQAMSSIGSSSPKPPPAAESPPDPSPNHQQDRDVHEPA
jgi:SulP family sulfate permease